MTKGKAETLTERARRTGKLGQESRKLRARADRLEKDGDRIGSHFDRKDADRLEAKAAELRELPGPVTKGAGGEVAQTSPTDSAGCYFLDTLEHPDTVAAAASRSRQELLAGVGNAYELGLDAAETIQPQNSLERMLAHQMAAVHAGAMKALATGEKLLGVGPLNPMQWNVEGCRLLNAAARLMATYKDGLETLHKLRAGGRQVVTVQHVNVEGGGQAVVAGQVQGGHKGGEGKK